MNTAEQVEFTSTMLAQIQAPQAQNEALVQALGQQRESLNLLQVSNNFGLEQVMASAVQASLRSSIGFSSNSTKGSSRPFQVPEYDGTRGEKWRIFKNKLLNELKRPNSSLIGNEYQFLYSKATGNFLTFLDSQNFEGLSINSILENLDQVFQGIDPRLEAQRLMSDLISKGSSLFEVEQYLYDFQSLQRATELMLKTYMPNSWRGSLYRTKNLYKTILLMNL